MIDERPDVDLLGQGPIDGGRLEQLDEPAQVLRQRAERDREPSNQGAMRADTCRATF